MPVKYQRQIIEVERRLGFMYVPAKGQEYMPNENKAFNVLLEGETRAMQLNYNAEHNRLFGLTAWYKANKIDTGSILDIELDENLMKVAFAKPDKALTEEDDEQETTLDISGLSTIAKGNIVEDRIKELVVLYGQGLLNVYRPVVDNGGIDLIVLRHQYFQPIYLQVKSRFNVQAKDQMILTISGNTFRAHHSFYVIGVSFNPNTLEVDDKILFMPSHDVEQMGIRLKHKSNIRIVASYKNSSKGQWSKYFIRKSELVSKLLEKFYEIEKYIK